MKRLRAWAAAAAAALVAAFALVALAERGDSDRRGDIAAFRPERVTRLSSDNLVDALVAQPFEEPIRRAEWRGAVLAIDFAVRPETVAPEELYRDLKTLVRLSFYQIGNVDRLLVRFVEERPADRADGRAEPRLLLASDVRRTDNWLEADADRLEAADLHRDPMWRQRFRLSRAPGWTERFGPLSPGGGASSADPSGQ